MEEAHTDNPTPADQAAPASATGEATPVGDSSHASEASSGSETSPTSPAVTPPAQKAPATEVRRAQRYRIKWRSAVLIGPATNQVTYHGWLKDISHTGTALFSEKAIPPNQTVELYIEVPAAIDDKEHILTIKARIVYVVYDAPENQFRSGIEFIKFSSSKDQTFLASYLNKHCHPLTHH